MKTATPANAASSGIRITFRHTRTYMTVRAQSATTASEQHPAQVPPEVMREEVRVDRRGDDRGEPSPRVPREAEIEEPVDAHHVRADGRVHEAAEQRNGADPQNALGGIAPRAHVGLEELHDRAGHVEQDDHPQLAAGLEPRRDHDHLDRDGGERHEVVRRERRVLGVPEPHRDDHDEQGCPEQARPRLLEQEDADLDEARPRALRRRIREEPVCRDIDPPLEARGLTHQG